MSNQEQFENLVNKDDNFLSFFTRLNNTEQKELEQLIYKLHKHYGETRQLTENSWGSLGTTNQIIGLKTCALYISDYKSYSKNIGSLPYNYFSSGYYKTYRPDWLQKHLDDNDRHFYLSYQAALDLIYNYNFKISDADIVPKLVQSISYYNRDTKKHIYTIEHFDQYPVCLEKHIWLLFTEESEVHFTDRYSRSGKGWIETLANFAYENKISRHKLLQECLLTSTRNFNKLASGWFFDLFIALKPTKKELFCLQKEILQVLNTKHSKPINVCLKIIKDLCVEDKFDTNHFISTTPILLSFEVKSVVTNTLMILDKIAKKHKSLQLKICEIATEAFIQQDEKIQERAAKLIVKYGDTKNETLKNNISNYYTELYTSIKKLLTDFSADTETEALEEDIDLEDIKRINEASKIEIPSTFDDMVFFITQAFENNEHHHFYIYLDVLPKLYKQITNSNFNKLEPAFKSAVKTLYSDSNRIGYIENIMATQFLNYVELLLQKFENKTIRKKLETLRLEDNERAESWEYFDKKVISINKLDYKIPSQKIFIELLTHSLNLSQIDTEVEMLSTPTHKPCYLDLNTFIERLIKYQKSNIEINHFDFQTAIARIVIDENYSEENLKNIKGEHLNILMYLTNNEVSLDLNECKTLSLWLITIYRKGNKADLQTFIDKYIKNTTISNLHLPVDWQHINEPSTRMMYNYELKKDMPEPYQNKELIIKTTLQNTKKRESYKNNITGIISSFINDNNKEPYYYYRPQDQPKLLYLMPFTPSKICLQLIKSHYSQTNWVEAEEIKATTITFPVLSEIWDESFDEMGYLYLSCGLLFGKKQGAQIAGELWIKAVSQNNINNELLGQILGKLQSTEYAPMKRLTDLITSQLLNISKTHNTALEKSVSNCISNLGDEPIRGTKKLLEIYNELLILNSSKANELALKKLDIYKNVKSLATVSKKIALI